jgi:hypothetical protein
MKISSGLTNLSEIWELHPVMKAGALLLPIAAAAPAAADSRAQAWLWRHDTTPAAARLHRW